MALFITTITVCQVVANEPYIMQGRRKREGKGQLPPPPRFWLNIAGLLIALPVLESYLHPCYDNLTL